MDDNFSPRVKDVISFSKEEALRLGHNFIGTEHLMLGMLRDGGGKAIAILPKYDQGSEVKTGDVLPSEIKPGLTELVNQQIAPLQDKIEGLLTSADSLFAGVSNVMNYQTQTNLKLALEGLAESVNNVAELTENMNMCSS